ncbi:cysteine proteinase [Cystobasidium minutum MCA 4210]|uniref:cysteine proteinase n=1 Tax=Cystobasidium minutum MCA 4210 TaxID=1397322 RepID=UPI0034CE8851|eukprot:jgi/Rhomi1/164776/fgenesh1_kg.1_\
MTQRDSPYHDENDSPSSRTARRRSSGAAKAATQSSPRSQDQPLAPVASTSFYGESSRPPARQPLHPIKPSNRKSSTDSTHAMQVDAQQQQQDTVQQKSLGINLDDPDTKFPSSPSSIVDAEEDLGATLDYPDVATMRLLGHGYLPNAILGHSEHPDFRLGAAFDWPKTFNPQDCMDYSLNSSFVPRPSASRAAAVAASTSQTSASSPSTPPTTVRSYSQALGSASPAQTPPVQGSTSTGAGQAPARQPSANTPIVPPSKTFTNPFSNTSLEQARPHPNAYFNPRTLAWTVVAHMSQNGQTSSQDSIAGQCQRANGEPLRTHHYVRLRRGIDPRFILRPSQPAAEPLQQNNLSTPSEGPSLGGPSSEPFPDPIDDSHACCWGQVSPPKNCWDLFVCSGCRNAFAVSPANVIPSVLGPSTYQAFTQARLAEEAAKSRRVDDAVVGLDAIEYLWKIIRNILYDNNRKGIPVQGTTFIKKLGESEHARAFFQRLRFSTIPLAEGKESFEPPPATAANNLLLARAFLELSLLLAAMSSAPSVPAGREVLDLVRPKPFTDALERIVGPDVVSKYVPSASDFSNVDAFAACFKILGVTPETGDEDIAFAYQSQVQSDATNGPYYLDSLIQIAQLRGDHRETLQMLIATERSQDRLSNTEVMGALAKLGLSPIPKPNQLFFDQPVNDLPNEDIIAAAYHESKERVPQQQGTESDLKELKDAVTILAKALRSDLLRVVLDSAAPSKPTFDDMTLTEAWEYLQVSSSLGDEVICSAASIMFFSDDSVSDYQKDKARAALSIVAEHRNSNGIRQFVETGMVPESVEAPREAPVSVDRPAGLQNIGNTCYLNSLLQYFFTIKQLREVVLNFDQYQETRPYEEIESSKRVGGRNISKREIERSRKFTKLLSQLFSELIHDKAASVRPTRDLAYLALVSSKDEDALASPALQPAPALSGGEAPNTTDGAEMAIDGEPIDQTVKANTADQVGTEGLAAAQSAEIDTAAEKVGSPSVLGKRNSDHFEDETAQMDIDPNASTRKTTSPEAVESALAASASSSGGEGDLIAQAGEDGVMEIVPESRARKASIPAPQNAPGTPPPLPPRTASTSIATTNMMFGRQNDVSEAMDNVLFQIESALDDSRIPKPSPAPTLSGEPCSFVQSLFYGTSLSTLELESDPDSKRTKEETFSYQLVDVAKDGNDLYDGLDAAFTPSIVEVEGKTARRQDILTQLPPILQIQLQRVQFDRTTSRVYKSNAYMPFPQTLRMGRYLSAEGRSADFAAKQSRSTQLRSDLTKLQARLAKLEQKDEDQQTTPDIFNTAADSLRQLSQSEDTEDPFLQNLRTVLGDADDNILTLLNQHASATEKDIIDTKQRLDACRREVEDIWSDDVENEYELSSVFIHLGAAGYGHYYLYQRALPYQPERWLKFNDESVTDVQVSEVFADTTGSTANPYWLTYVRKSEIADRIDAVCRNFV